MEENKDTKSVKIAKSENMIEVPIELIQSMKNIIEVITSRVHWKTSELMPVGILVTRLNEYLESSK